MKTRYVLGALAVLLTCFMLVSEEAFADGARDFLIQNYSVDLTVDCLEDAILTIENMPGISLSTSANIQWGWSYVRLVVDNRDLVEALDVLAGMGVTNSTSTNARNVFSRVSGLQSELQVREGELARLMELLYEVDTLENFNAVENRLVQVIWVIERINGSLNNYGFETGTTRININLTAAEPGSDIEFVPVTALGRIGNAFMDSAGFSLSMIQLGLLVFAYASIPLAGVLVLVCLFWFVMVKLPKMRKGAGNSRGNVKESGNGEVSGDDEETENEEITEDQDEDENEEIAENQDESENEEITENQDEDENEEIAENQDEGDNNEGGSN